MTKSIETEYMMKDKAEMRNQKEVGTINWVREKEEEDTESFIWPTMQSFHVWNLDIINNTYSSVQYSRPLGVKVQD